MYSIKITGFADSLPFFNAPILEKYVALKISVLVSGFIDDVYLLAYSYSTKANDEIIIKVYKYYVE